MHHVTIGKVIQIKTQPRSVENYHLQTQVWFLYNSPNKSKLQIFIKSCIIEVKLIDHKYQDHSRYINTPVYSTVIDEECCNRMKEVEKNKETKKMFQHFLFCFVSFLIFNIMQNKCLQASASHIVNSVPPVCVYSYNIQRKT